MMYVVQRDSPPAQRGRVISILQALVGFSYGIGILWLGVVGDSINLRVSFGLASGLLSIAIILLARRFVDWRGSIDHGSAAVDQPASL